MSIKSSGYNKCHYLRKKTYKTRYPAACGGEVHFGSSIMFTRFYDITNVLNTIIQLEHGNCTSKQFMNRGWSRFFSRLFLRHSLPIIAAMTAAKTVATTPITATEMSEFPDVSAAIYNKFCIPKPAPLCFSLFSHRFPDYARIFSKDSRATG